MDGTGERRGEPGLEDSVPALWELSGAELGCTVRALHTGSGFRVGDVGTLCWAMLEPCAQ
jgi:hypothetical protein